MLHRSGGTQMQLFTTMASPNGGLSNNYQEFGRSLANVTGGGWLTTMDDLALVRNARFFVGAPATYHLNLGGVGRIAGYAFDSGLPAKVYDVGQESKSRWAR